MSKFKLPVVVAGLYALLFAIALWFPLSSLADDPLSGLYAVLLGSPWSFVTVAVLDALDPALLDGNLGIVGIGIGGVINTVLIYLLLRWVVGRSAEKTNR